MLWWTGDFRANIISEYWLIRWPVWTEKPELVKTSTGYRHREAKFIYFTLPHYLPCSCIIIGYEIGVNATYRCKSLHITTSFLNWRICKYDPTRVCVVRCDFIVTLCLAAHMQRLWQLWQRLCLRAEKGFYFKAFTPEKGVNILMMRQVWLLACF